MTEFLTLNELKELIAFAKASGLKHFKAGDFECELPPMDVNQDKLDALNTRIVQLEGICSRLSIQVNKQIQMRSATPFTARVTANEQ